MYTSCGDDLELWNKTIGRCLKEQVGQNGERSAVEFAGKSWSFSELDELSDRLALDMLNLGVEKGTHVGIWSVNSPQWVVTFLAAVKLGAVPVLINTCYRQEEMKGILNYSQVKVLFYGAGYRDLVYGQILEGIRDELSCLTHTVLMDPMDMEARPLTAQEKARLETISETVCPQDPACMIFTSGTTSLPKGVILTHYNLVNNARAMIRAMHWSAEEKMCITVPMFHCFGITSGIVSCVLGGMCMYLIPYFKTIQVWDALEAGECTVLNGVPSMFLALIRKAEYQGKRARRLRSGIIAGSPVSKEDFLEICGRFPEMHLQTSYGQTETSPCVTIADWDDLVEKKAVSAGRVIPHVQVRICDLDTGAELGKEEDGEIQVKGYNVMAGYFNLPQANQQVFTEDGWLRTGDIGHIDQEDELHITGRLKEMIIRAGENISPQEIEAVIRSLDWVEQVKVVGIPAQVRQEEIAACVIPKEGRTVDPEGLKTYLDSRLAHYKVPSYVLEFQEFPMNASGKIHLKRLKESAAAMAADMPAPKS